MIDFYLKKEEPLRSCLLAMRDLIIEFDSSISETRKYGMPCFIYNGKAFCYLWIDKKTFEPYYLIVDGNKLDHPELESGDRARMKIFRVSPDKDLPVATIFEIFEATKALYE